MNKIVFFPTNEVRNKAAIERSLRRVLPGKGYSQTVIDLVINNISEFLDLICTDLQCSITTSDSQTINNVKTFQTTLNECHHRLVMERVNAELARCHEIGIK